MKTGQFLDLPLYKGNDTNVFKMTVYKCSRIKHSFFLNNLKPHSDIIKR